MYRPLTSSRTQTPGTQAPGTRAPRPPGPARVRWHRAGPLARNSYALAVNTAAAAALGLLYWLLAARHYPAASVGRGTAALAAMNMLAGITALSLTGAMAKFLPRAGQSAGRLVRGGYAATAAASLVAAAIFLLIAPAGRGSYSELRGWPAGLAFLTCVLAWGIFTLQDGVLVGLRSAAWIAAENAGFGVAKLVLLVILAAALPAAGLYASWMLPVLVAVPLVNLLIFGRLLPAHVRQHGAGTTLTAGQVGRFLAGDFTGSLCMLGTSFLAPVIVALLVRPADYAYFYIAFTIGLTLDLLGVNMAAALTVEGAHDPAGLAAAAAAALRRAVRIVAPLAVAAAVAAPFALRLYGGGYARHGVPVLELLLAATLPRLLTEMYLGSLRAKGRSAVIARIQLGRAVVLVALVTGLTTAWGITGAAAAILASQVITATVIAPGLLRLRPGRAARNRPAEGAAR
jgi:O-antigen/teichoic acid export membrane protein